MKLVFDIESSVLFWRHRYPLTRMPQPQLCELPEECAASKHDIVALMPDWADKEFLAPSNGIFHSLDVGGNCSKRYIGIAVHAWQGPVPPGSFYELRTGIFIESPAFMFLHAGTLLDLPSLIAFGCELCGYYSFDEREPRGFRKRKQALITRFELVRFIKNAVGCRGRKACLKALEFVIDGSASPMETLDEMLLCLPYRHGGYGLLKPLMNHCVPLTGRAARIAKRGKCYLDMGYPHFSLDVEHHGKYDHSSLEEINRDIERVNGLKEMGYEVIELTAAQVEDLLAFEAIVQRIAKITGKRIIEDALGPLPVRLELRKSLFRWNLSSGRIRQ